MTTPYWLNTPVISTNQDQFTGLDQYVGASGLFSDLTYQILANGAMQSQTDPRDYLVVFASESGLNPASTKGMLYHGFNTMTKEGAVAAGIDPDMWEMLPDMPSEDNMRASMQFFITNLQRAKRAGFASALDVYLFNFSPAVWSQNAGPDTIIYAAPSNAYWDNSSMDNYPALYDWAARKGLSLVMKVENPNQITIREAGKQAVAEGVLKGKITVADLRAFILRPAVKSVWAPHVARLTELGLAPKKSYQSVGYGSDDYNPDVPWDKFSRERQERSGKPLPPPPSPEPGLIPIGELPWWLKLLALGGVGYGGYKIATRK